MKAHLRLFAAMMLGLLCTASAVAAENEPLVTAIFSKISNGYERKKLPDGSYQREYYALANGQYVPGQLDNESIDKVKFPTIAGLVAQHLAKQNYFLAQDSKSADILLLISWGTTIPFGDNGSRNAMDRTLNAMNAANAAARRAAAAANPQTANENVKAETAAVAAAAQGELEGQLIETKMFNDMRTKADEQNAMLLGYSEEINNKNNLGRLAGGGSYFDDLMSDIEEERYFVIVSAYDFRTAVHDGKRKLLWATRISVRAQGNRFDQNLTEMLANASSYFGRNSRQLIRQYHNGNVKIGDMKVIGVTPESTTPAKTPDEK